MNSTHPVPPLPQPQPPAAAAQAFTDAAQAAARAWAQPLDSARHQRAVSQLDSVLRDLGIAARGLAAWQVSGVPSGPVPREFARHVTAAARWLLRRVRTASTACWPSRGSARCPIPTSPAPLCATPRATSSRPGGSRRAPAPTAMPPSGASSPRPGSCPPRRSALPPTRRAAHAIDLQAALSSLAEATADLSAAIPETADDTAPEHRAGPAPDYPGARE